MVGAERDIRFLLQMRHVVEMIPKITGLGPTRIGFRKTTSPTVTTPPEDPSGSSGAEK
jgi:hypothetical protein